jgi:hypothetical protein
VVEAADVVGVGELDHMASAIDVRLLHGLLLGVHVVDRRKVEEVVDPLVEALHPQRGLREVARDRHDPALIGSK